MEEKKNSKNTTTIWWGDWGCGSPWTRSPQRVLLPPAAAATRLPARRRRWPHWWSPAAPESAWAASTEWGMESPSWWRRRVVRTWGICQGLDGFREFGSQAERRDRHLYSGGVWLTRASPGGSPIRRHTSRRSDTGSGAERNVPLNGGEGHQKSPMSASFSSRNMVWNITAWRPGMRGTEWNARSDRRDRGHRAATAGFRSENRRGVLHCRGYCFKALRFMVCVWMFLLGPLLVLHPPPTEVTAHVGWRRVTSRNPINLLFIACVSQKEQRRDLCWFSLPVTRSRLNE